MSFGQIRFGVCGGSEEAAAILGAGFDYVEVGASGFAGFDEEWDRSPYDGLELPATNLFFDGRVRLHGVGLGPYREYAQRTIGRAASLGVKTMVVGSGNARRVPDGEEGDAAFIKVVAGLQEIANEYGIAMAPESLNADETNVGVLLRPLALGLREVGVAYTADSYHVLREWDRAGRPSDLVTLWKEEMPFCPTHVHVGPMDRGVTRGDDPMLVSFARALRDLGYAGLVSLEVTRGPEFDFVAANLALRELFA